MFILSGLILEDGENLFRDFWSLFNIPFVCFFARNNLRKKSEPTTGRFRPGLPGRGLYIARPRGPTSPKPPPPQTLAPPARRPSHRRRRPPLPRRRSSGTADEVDLAAAVFFRKPLVFTGFRSVSFRSVF